tara:strand:- start:868 stop:2970 length:2103 start_codon:yes stop_codon:yes gene_type:complete
MPIKRISKIQVKRGKRADLPPLDAGEFGYCLDTRELFIGGDVDKHDHLSFPKTVQLNSNVATANNAESLIDNHVVEFIVKRAVLNVDDNTNTYGSSKGVWALNSSTVSLTGGYSTATSIASHEIRNLFEPLTPRFTLNNTIQSSFDYTFNGNEFTVDDASHLVDHTSTNTSRFYITYINSDDIKTYIVANFNTDNGNFSDLEVMKLKDDQLYFDPTTGTGFFGLNTRQTERSALSSSLSSLNLTYGHAIDMTAGSTGPITVELRNSFSEAVTAGSFVVGQKYTITGPVDGSGVYNGTTDFTLIGAANSDVGTIFTATGAGTGTGIAADTIDKSDTSTHTFTNTDATNYNAMDDADKLIFLINTTWVASASASYCRAEKITYTDLNGATKFVVRIFNPNTGILTLNENGAGTILADMSITAGQHYSIKQKLTDHLNAGPGTTTGLNRIKAKLASVDPASLIASSSYTLNTTNNPSTDIDFYGHDGMYAIGSGTGNLTFKGVTNTSSFPSPTNYSAMIDKTFDSNLSAAFNSIVGAKNVTQFLNKVYRDNVNSDIFYSTIKSNQRLLTEGNIANNFVSVRITEPIVVSHTYGGSGTDVFSLGETFTPFQMGGTSGARHVVIEYTLEQGDVVRVGEIRTSFPDVSGSNLPIIDTYNEVNTVGGSAVSDAVFSADISNSGSGNVGSIKCSVTADTRVIFTFKTF